MDSHLSLCDFTIALRALQASSLGSVLTVLKFLPCKDAGDPVRKQRGAWFGGWPFNHHVSFMIKMLNLLTIPVLGNSQQQTSASLQPLKMESVSLN